MIMIIIIIQKLGALYKNVNWHLQRYEYFFHNGEQ
jgi:hypothetical protein